MRTWLHVPVVRIATTLDSIRARGSRLPCTAALIGLATLAGCLASSPGTFAPHDDVFASVTTGNPVFRGADTRLTASDLARTQASSTLDAIRLSRPDFLRTSARASMAEHNIPPSVYLDGHYVGGLEALNTIPLNVVREVVFMHPTDARERLGSRCECGGGVLAIRTR